MKTWLCARIGHRWVRVTPYAPKAFVCKRCHEAGMWVSR